MKRRSFLAMLGLAPVATVPTLASKQTPNEYLPELIRKSEAPFTFDGGIARMNVANIGEIHTGSIRGKDGSFLLDLSVGQMVWR